MSSGPDRDQNRFRLVVADGDELSRAKVQHQREFTDRKHKILLGRLSTPGDECYLVTDATGAIYGYCHVAIKTTLNARINYRVVLGASDIYFFDDHTFRPHRRSGVHSFAIAERRRLMNARGYQRGLTIISDKNVASITSYRQFGARPVRKLAHIRRFGRTASYPHPDTIRRHIRAAFRTSWPTGSPRVIGRP